MTERLADRTLALPTGAAIGEKDIRIIGEIIATAIGRAGRVVQERTPQTRGKQAEEYARIGARWGGELIWGALQVGLLAGM